MGQGVAAVEALGGLLGLEDELIEAVVGATPRVPPGLTRGHSLRKAVEVAAPEGPDGDGRAAMMTPLTRP